MKIIEQHIEFAGVDVQDLYDTYMDARRHSAAIGAPAQVDARVGGSVAAFGDRGVCGRILHLVPHRLVVQTWRSKSRWRDEEDDSILVLNFESTDQGAAVCLVHTGVPERELKLFDEGWHERYWHPWRAYFAQRSSAPNEGQA